MTYFGTECWQLSISNRKRVDTLQMDWLRRPCQTPRLEHLIKKDIRRRTGRVCTTIGRMEARQFIWYRQVMIMGEYHWSKRVLNYNSNNRRKRRIPLLTCIDGVHKTMTNTGIEEEAWRDGRRWRLKCGMWQRL